MHDLIQTLEGSNPQECRKAALTVASQAHRLNAIGDTREVLEALGLLKPAARALGGRRDNLGRLRTFEAPVRAISDSDAPAMCPTGEHEWVEANIYHHIPSGKKRCRPCDQRRNKQYRATGTGRKPVDPDAPVYCRCPGEKHILTEGPSKSTYVSPAGRRMCKVAIDRRKAAKNAARRAKTAERQTKDTAA